MSKYLLVLLLIASPAAAQVKLAPKTSAAHPDPCAPIGRTADGKLVYSMKCENLPAPPPPPPQAELKEAPPSAAPAADPEPGVRRSGIFGWSYDRR
ncbi:hypothetical protein AB7Z32_12700 [Bradyrhizobium sp. 482_C4_N1_1]|uniref:hypothetical protein n=1 Tax=unclassified Bradyrhizobium TaxID=2631580 RepID=UPI0033932F6B